ncbi:NAD(P)H-dependent flavin oxidoreductase [Anianabacter salinae]|uniref:NAD(P)H-dependent flavin oxidoreductase n=1 Tax=Anianabacter salinae TaxID=2851023 RepID=UPI00225DD69D|nr:nitronate monooxygenase [Anianabacter salinae]MBV0911419.1 nitronate monooxygenase [Anianabacter salinae]
MIVTRLTERFGLTLPVLSAPMAKAGGGRLAAAVTGAGGLGLIGGSYADGAWLRSEIAAAGNAGVGVGFITWALAKAPEALDIALEHDPRALMLSFGDPAPFAARIAGAGVPLICQVQTLRDAKAAVAAGAAVIVAQGAEAGGHGERRATITLVPEVADMLARRAPEVLLLAAGGIADGRGLAAALMLGADGVLVGSRLWASEEALVHPAMHAAALGATGDDTIRSTVMDVARRLDWPDRYTARVLRNAFTDRWHGDVPGLLAVAEAEAARWAAAWESGDTDTANTFVGEAVGMIDRIEPAGAILRRMTDEAEALLAGGWKRGS